MGRGGTRHRAASACECYGVGSKAGLYSHKKWPGQRAVGISMGRCVLPVQVSRPPCISPTAHLEGSLNQAVSGAEASLEEALLPFQGNPSLVGSILMSYVSLLRSNLNKFFCALTSVGNTEWPII